MPRALANHPKCGAHCRTTGRPCRQQAMRNGRCKMHGGKAGRKPTHGRYSAAAVAERRQVRELVDEMTRLLKETAP